MTVNCCCFVLIIRNSANRLKGNTLEFVGKLISRSDRRVRDFHENRNFQAVDCWQRFELITIFTNKTYAINEPFPT